jgi:hypothetical protein
MFVSPKFHNHDVIVPAEVSLNVTVTGATPVMGTPVKSAIGAGSPTVM